MASFRPSFISTTPPVTVISTDGTSYEEILQGLGSNLYKLLTLYFSCNSIDQVLKPINIYKYDSNGEVISKFMVPAMDINQFQNAYLKNTEKLNIIFNGLCEMNFTILPGEEIYLVLGTKKLSFSDFLPKDGDFSDNFFN